MDLFDSLTTWVGHAVFSIANPVLGIHSKFLLEFGFLGMILLLVGGRTARVVKPDRPYLSPVLRKFGFLSKLLGILMTGTGLSWFLIVIFLLYIYNMLSGYSSYDALLTAWLLLWNHGRQQISTWAVGSVAAVIIS